MRVLRSTLILIVLTVFAFSSVHALELPARPSGYVNDYADILSASVKQQLERELAQFEAAESTQIVVVTLPDIQGENLEDIGIRLADQWQIGRKGADNGVIVMVAPNDRQARIEVGYGLEDKLTDAVASQIISQEMAPTFRRGDYSQGILSGVSAIQAAVRGAYFVREKQQAASGFSALTWVFIILFIILFIFPSRRRRYSGYGRNGLFAAFLLSGLARGRGRGGFGGGGFGGGGGGRFGGGGSTGSW